MSTPLAWFALLPSVFLGTGPVCIPSTQHLGLHGFSASKPPQSAAGFHKALVICVLHATVLYMCAVERVRWLGMVVRSLMQKPCNALPANAELC